MRPREAARHPLHAGEVGADPAARAEGEDEDLALRRALLPARGGSGGRAAVGAAGPSAGAWPEDEQRRLLADSLAVSRASCVTVKAPGGERVELPLHAVVRFLLLCEEEDG